MVFKSRFALRFAGPLFFSQGFGLFPRDMVVSRTGTQDALHSRGEKHRKQQGFDFDVK